MDAQELIRITKKLEAENRRLVSLADRATERFYDAMQRAEQRLFDRIAAVINEAPDLRALSVKARLAWYAENVETTARMLRASGFPAAAKSYMAALEEIAEQAAVASAAARDAGFSSVPAEFVKFVQGRSYEHLKFLGRQAVAKLDETLLEMTVGGSSRGAMLSELKSTITGSYPWGNKQGLYEWHAGTYVRTSAQRMAQMFMNYQAERYGLGDFLYTGPLDQNTRPFCRRLLASGRTYTRAEIDAMENGQTLDVYTTCGGHNCRHKWVAVNAEFAGQLAAA